MNFEEANGNGSLMRIIPACLYAYVKKMPIDISLKMIHEVSGLTHNHIRSHIACGLYYFCVCSILDNDGTLCTRLQKAMNDGFSFYERSEIYRGELKHYARLRDLNMFKSIREDNIRSSGYVVDSLEAALWALLKTNTFKECLLSAVNLAYDADTIGAIAGGLAGLYYGYDNIPKDWLDKIKKREFIEEMCLVEI